MSENSTNLCSDLMRVRLLTGEVVIGNLEEISASGCLLSLDQPILADSTIQIECVNCPRGEPRCSECRLTAKVIDQYEDPTIGLMTIVEFVGGGPERWKPRHLLSMESKNPATKVAGGALEH